MKSERVSKFWQDDPAYHGVLVSSGRWRLVVSPNGKRYCLQEMGETGRYCVRRWRKSLALLRDDIPAALCGPELDGLPDDPLAVARPWADEMALASERLKAARDAEKTRSKARARVSTAREYLRRAERALEALDGQSGPEGREKLQRGADGPENRPHE